MSVGTVRGVGKYHHPMFCTTYSFLFSSRQPNDIFMILQKYIYTQTIHKPLATFLNKGFIFH